MSWRSTLRVLAGIGAAISLFIGAAALKWYVWDIVIGQAGESDRSMLFWGLPIVMIGLSSIATGVVLIWLVRTRLSRRLDRE